MVKNTQTKEAIKEYKDRLQEIAQTQFGLLSDDELLGFLAERKHLSLSVLEYETKEQEEAVRLEREKEAAALKASEKKKIAISKKIEELNKSISPDKKDDDLLVLISERKELEKELAKVDEEFVSEKEDIQSEPVSPSQVEADVFPEEKLIEIKREPVVVLKKEKIVEEAIPEVTLPEITIPKEEFGSEKIQNDGIEENSEFGRYFDQLKNNTGSLGELLQQMPLAAKKNKAFMLRVAEIDPAYAMHYADKDTLKREEDFNMRIASLNNPRNSGNALSEMLPEARTSKVLLVAVKQDYRNIKFVRPDMADYDEIMSIAKKEALEKIKSLKEATDISLLIPRLLQQDKQFMLQVNELADVMKNQ